MESIRNHAHRRTSSLGHWASLLIIVAITVASVRASHANEDTRSALTGITDSDQELVLRSRHATAKTETKEFADALDARLEQSFSSAGGLVDRYPASGAFRITGGAIY